MPGTQRFCSKMGPSVEIVAEGLVDLGVVVVQSQSTSCGAATWTQRNSDANLG